MSKFIDLCRVVIKKKGPVVLIQRIPLDDDDCDYLEIRMPSIGTVNTCYLLTRFQVNITNLASDSDCEIVVTSRRASDGKRGYNVLIELEDGAVVLSESYDFPNNRSIFKRAVGGLELEIIEG
ncbi:MAG: hypothetical protein JHC31_09550 [Sulfurihydrogenibium sp.]|nr:hypothetical protein [Sulfurihydrogenibium sp.]